MRHYELMFILKPTLTQEEAEAKVDFAREILEKNGAAIKHIEKIGIKKLAYLINKHERGNYNIVYFTAPASSIKEVERLLRINENFMKFMTIKYESKKDILHWENLSSPKSSTKIQQSVQTEESSQTEENAQEVTKEQTKDAQ